MTEQTYICEECGKEFERDDISLVKSRIRFCDSECADKAYNSYIEREKKEEEKKRIESLLKDMPKKVREIETDISFQGLLERGCYIVGPVGTGKTILMGSIAKHFVSKGSAIRWISYPEFVIDIKRKFSGNQDPYRKAEYISKVRCPVFIDDIGVEKQSDFVKELTYFIINSRESEELKTYFTSNIPLNKLEDRIASRILSMCRVVKLDGKDRRI